MFTFKIRLFNVYLNLGIKSLLLSNLCFTFATDYVTKGKTMKEILVTECRSCPFESEDGYGGSYCRIDTDGNGYTTCNGTPEWCPLFDEDVLVQIGDIDETEFKIADYEQK